MNGFWSSNVLTDINGNDTKYSKAFKNILSKTFQMSDVGQDNIHYSSDKSCVNWMLGHQNDQQLKIVTFIIQSDSFLTLNNSNQSRIVQNRNDSWLVSCQGQQVWCWMAQ